MDPNMEKDLRMHHWRLNHDNKHSWDTYNQMMHGDKSGQADPDTVGKSKQLKKELRAEHFKVGNFNSDFRSINSTYHQDSVG